MKIITKHVRFSNGFLRFSNGVEFHWSLRNWVLLFAVDADSEYLMFIGFLCFNISIPYERK